MNHYIIGFIVVFVVLILQTFLSRKVNRPYLGIIIPIIYICYLLYVLLIAKNVTNLWVWLLILIGGEAILLEIQYSEYNKEKNKK